LIKIKPLIGKRSFELFWVKLMIFDIRSLSNGEMIECDICIIGAGVAGLSFAVEFVNKGFNVAVMESGDTVPSVDIQSLNYGDNVGFPYFELDQARVRAFGGTSHQWKIKLGDDRLGVRLRAMDEIDFEERDWIPYSGWPFRKRELDPYYERAHEFCQIGKYSYDISDWKERGDEYVFPFDRHIVDTTIFQFTRKEILYRHYGELLSMCENIRVFLHATVGRIQMDENARNVEYLHVTGLHKKEYKVKARYYILAGGGLEIPRLLFLSDDIVKNGVGNDHDLVGRFFMEHPHLRSGYIVPNDIGLIRKLDMYKIHVSHDVHIMAKLRLAEDYIRKHRLLNFSMAVYPRSMSEPPEVIKKTKSFLKSLIRGKVRSKKDFTDLYAILKRDPTGIPGYLGRRSRAKLDAKYRQKINTPSVLVLNPMSEQAPNHASRVTLDNKRDSLGQRRIKLDWRLSEIDIKTILVAQKAIKSQLEEKGIGTMVIEMKDYMPPVDLRGGWHHMGTTRMHNDPKLGVVDQDCKIHSVSNLYVASASVFPTVGYANPVLTTVALSIRLADHIRNKFDSSVERSQIERKTVRTGQ
jgi:choline dehydrogenase-like flavoprotein